MDVGWPVTSKRGGDPPTQCFLCALADPRIPGFPDGSAPRRVDVTEPQEGPASSTPTPHRPRARPPATPHGDAAPAAPGLLPGPSPTHGSAKRPRTRPRERSLRRTP